MRFLLSLAALLSCLAALVAAPAATPPVLLHSAASLQAARESLARGEPALKPSLAALLREADRTLELREASVMDKKGVAASGDRHDYFSFGPYWWPDPAKADGLPYIQRDGEVNTAGRDQTDDTAFGQLCSSVETLGLAYWFTGREAYADKAARLVRVWFLEPATRMNPNLQHAQAIPGRSTGRGIGLIESRRLMDLNEGLALIGSSASWTAGDRAALRAWMDSFYTWITTSRNGRDEHAAKNNHGSWYDAQTAHLALVLGRKDEARRILSEALTLRLATQVEPDGSQPHELARTKSLDYSVFNLQAFFSCAALGRHVGVDWWAFRTPDGRSLRGALAFLAPYADPDRPWPRKDLHSKDRKPLIPLLVRYLEQREDSGFRELLDRFWGLAGDSARWRLQLFADPLQRLVSQAIARSARQYEWMLAHLPDRTRQPRTVTKGRLVQVKERDWTVGFFPGSLWYLHEATGQDEWRKAATELTALLVHEQHNTRTHDVGFILNCSFGNGYRLTGDPAYRGILLQGAKSLSTRYSPVVAAIKSWDRDPSLFNFPVIIDNMMNLELLLWAARSGGEGTLREIAVTHADTTLRNHFRPDGSCFHVIDYDGATGKVLRRKTHQGAADGSAWARGQAWALYGYTLMYRETREPRYLEQASRVADFILNHPRLPADKVPYWDFDAPGLPEVPRDSSAAAIMSSSLFELADHAASPEKAAAWRGLALEQLRSLASPRYLAEPGQNGGFLLQHATGNHPAGTEIDAPLNYADYYFLEALLRCRAHLNTRP